MTFLPQHLCADDESNMMRNGTYRTRQEYVIVGRKWWVIMLGRAALLVKSKVAIAVLGVLVAGTGGTAALAATGHLPSLPSAANAAQSTNDHSNSSSRGHTIGVEGVLKSYDAGAKTISVQAQNETTATTIIVNAQTRVNGASATQLSDLSANVGHKVQVQAEKQSNGALLAWKITVEGSTGTQGSGSADRREVAGTVASVSATGFVVKVAGGAMVTVTTNDTTTFQLQGAAGGLSAVKVGVRVEVHGATQADGSFLATIVQIEDNSGSGHGDSHG